MMPEDAMTLEQRFSVGAACVGAEDIDDLPGWLRGPILAAEREDRAPKKRPSPAESAEGGGHTGGMVALLPSREHADLLTIPGGEPAAQLHLTLAYLGDDVTWLRDDPDVAEDLYAAVQTALADSGGPRGPITARVFAHTTFNADGGPDGDRPPCAVYGIGDTPLLAPLRAALLTALDGLDGLTLPAQHEPYMPHVTAGYGLTAADLTYLGAVRFDRIVVALGEDRTVIPLTTTERATPPPVTEAAAGGWPGWAHDRAATRIHADRLTAALGAIDVHDIARRALTSSRG